MKLPTIRNFKRHPICFSAQSSRISSIIKCLAIHWTAQIRWPLSTLFFFSIFATALWHNQPSGSYKAAGAWGWPFTYIQHSTPIRFMIRCWLTGAIYRCHAYAMTNVIKHSYSRRQFHGPVGAARMHVNRRRQPGGHDKIHRRFSDYANAPTNVTKTQMVTI